MLTPGRLRRRLKRLLCCIFLLTMWQTWLCSPPWHTLAVTLGIGCLSWFAWPENANSEQQDTATDDFEAQNEAADSQSQSLQSLDDSAADFKQFHGDNKSSSEADADLNSIDLPRLPPSAWPHRPLLVRPSFEFIDCLKSAIQSPCARRFVCRGELLICGAQTAAQLSRSP